MYGLAGAFIGNAALDSYALTLLVGQSLIALAPLMYGIFFYINRSVWHSRSKWRQALVMRAFSGWGISVTAEELFAVQESLRLSWRPILLLAALGAAGSLLLELGVAVVVSLLRTGTLAGLDSVDSNLWEAGMYLTVTLGVGAGYIAGLWWAKWSMRGRVSYGDLEPRRLVNYRTRWFFWLQVALIAGYLVVTALTLPFLTAPLSLGDWTFQQGFWLPWVLPIAMIIVALGTEQAASRLAAAPRLLLVPDPRLARQLDDMLRAQVIGQLQGFVLLTLAMLGAVQALFLLSNTGPAAPLLQLAFVLTIILGLCCLSVFFLNGHLGGKRTGWPWTARAVQ